MSAQLWRATGQDWANHIARIQDSDSLLHIIAQFQGTLDERLLEHAVLTTLQLEPVLACRFDESQAPPCWTPVHTQSSRDWFRITATGSPENAIRYFIEETPLEEERQVLVQLIHGPAGDAVCIKLDHSCCDGGGAKAYLLLLCNTYNRLFNGTLHCLEENTIPGFPERSSERVYAACGIRDIRQAYKAGKDAPLPTVTVPYREGTPSLKRCEMLRIPLSELRQRDEGTTVNDLLLAAFARALAGLDTGLPQTAGETRQATVNLTIDLRRYLPREQQPVVCNLSGMEKVSAVISPEEHFGQTVKTIHEMMSELKASNPGLHSAVSMDFLTRLPYPQGSAMLLQASSRLKTSGQSAPIFSNLGWLSPEELSFGGTAASEIYAVTPAMYAPAFMLGASSYGSTLTLVASYFEPERSSAFIRSLLGAMEAQLTERDCPNLTIKVN